MKLRKLTIHNIASIQDATINFDATPLCDSDVFLISGETGSGKSTILDTICLALYGTTPRMKNTRMEGVTNGVDETTQIKDPAQMLRRNTGEGFARLTFAGNNGIEYEAEWSIRRARNRTNGRLQPRTHTLTFTDAAGRRQIYSKERERADEILRATGHTFDQFCRTTLLAQGDFARFLNSRDQEKAEILERITSAYIYTDIGSRTFTITRDKKNALDEAIRRKGDIELLTPEQSETLQQIIDECDRLVNEYTARRNTLTASLNWHNEHDTITRRLDNAAAALATALNTTQTDEYVAYVTLVEQWQATDEARMLCRQIRTASADKVCLSRLLSALGSDYQRIEAGHRYLHDSIMQMRRELADTQQAIDSERDRAAVYAAKEAVIAHLDNIAAKAEAINAASKTAEKSQRIIDEKLVPARDEASRSLADTEKNITECRDQINLMQKQLDDLAMPQLRRRLEAENDIISNIKSARTRIEAYLATKKRHDDDLNRLAMRSAALAEARRQLPVAVSQETEAAKALESATQAYAMQLDTVDKWAKAMRSRLHHGDTCPVCRQHIAHNIPAEEELDALCTLAKHNHDVADKHHRDIKERTDALRADIKVRAEQIEAERQRIEADNSVELSLTSATEACRLCGIDILGDDSDTLLVGMLEEASARKAHTELRISDAEAIANRLGDRRKELDRLMIQREKTVNVVNNATSKIADETVRINEALTQSKTHQTDIETSQAEVSRLLGDTHWEHDPLAEHAQFVTELRAMAQHYDTLTASATATQSALTLKQAQYDLTTDALTAATATYPALTEIGPLTAAATDDIVGAAARLHTDIVSTCERLTAADNTIASATAALNRFVDDNPTLTHELIATLDEQYNATRIKNISNEIQHINNTLSEATAIHRQLSDQLDTHLKNKPLTPDPETNEQPVTPQSLADAIATLDDSITAHARRRGETEQQLAIDRRQRDKLADILTEIEHLRAEYDRWAHLNELIGDAGGSKFRKIAQSFVLADLIHSANRYMHTLSGRYTLHVDPGSFVIQIEDAYQGYVRRPVSTISGGETFLVSLALALALSDAGNGLTADILFIDEGFDTLSGVPLQRAIDTLRQLHHRAGRHVGIISHIEELRERIPVQILLTRQPDSSSSTVTIV